ALVAPLPDEAPAALAARLADLFEISLLAGDIESGARVLVERAARAFRVEECRIVRSGDAPDPMCEAARALRTTLILDGRSILARAPRGPGGADPGWAGAGDNRPPPLPRGGAAPAAGAGAACGPRARLAPRPRPPRRRERSDAGRELPRSAPRGLEPQRLRGVDRRRDRPGRRRRRIAGPRRRRHHPAPADQRPPRPRGRRLGAVAGL